MLTKILVLIIKEKSGIFSEDYELIGHSVSIKKIKTNNKIYRYLGQIYVNINKLGTIFKIRTGKIN